MGSRFFIKICKKIALLITICVLALNIGCPPAVWTDCYYKHNSKKRTKYIIPVKNGSAKVNVYCNYGLGQYYIIKVYILVEYSHNSEKFHYIPESIRILYNDQSIDAEKAITKYSPNKGILKEYVKRYKYSNHSEFYIDGNIVKANAPIELKIILDNFMYINDEEITFDTLKFYMDG